MVRAIIFDCFGVLASDGWLPFKREKFGDTPALFQEATDLNRQLDAGLLPFDAFVVEVARLANVPVAEAARYINHNVPDADLFRFIKDSLHGRYKLGMLSNAGANWLNEIFTKDQVQLFDEVALSYQTGFVKPDARAYDTIAQKLDVLNEECIFIDDQERYCQGAIDAGMQAVRFIDTTQLRTDLLPLLADTDDEPAVATELFL